MAKKPDIPAPLPLPRPQDIQLAEVANYRHFVDELRDKHTAPDGQFDFANLIMEAAGNVPGADLLEIPVKRAVFLAYMIGLEAGSEPFREKSPV